VSFNGGVEARWCPFTTAVGFDHAHRRFTPLMKAARSANSADPEQVSRSLGVGTPGRRRPTTYKGLSLFVRKRPLLDLPQVLFSDRHFRIGPGRWSRLTVQARVGLLTPWWIFTGRTRMVIGGRDRGPGSQQSCFYIRSLTCHRSASAVLLLDFFSLELLGDEQSPQVHTRIFSVPFAFSCCILPYRPQEPRTRPPLDGRSLPLKEIISVPGPLPLIQNHLVAPIAGDSSLSACPVILLYFSPCPLCATTFYENLA